MWFNKYAYGEWMHQLFRLLKPTDPYYRHWMWFCYGLDFRHGGGSFLVMLPWMVLMVYLWTVWDSKYLMFVMVGLCVLTNCIVWWLLPLRCPRCQLAFYNWSNDMYSQERCVHCGLQVFAPHGEL